ncbi:hypothetical protein [Beggiatoa leptomitoformis]|uniref:Tip attachment protein J domain-containing protein n=1 Tax=Beggiatoa leptomitoformis TaxID=288004 RepID=A0A2N9YHD0_9GAMM|nr:hypothetical protein [Beggiatoa leptomitoformis]ALG67866.1 hypothetical protein AL038_09285 [Beggiatoa leptomitoformis]AUI69873.1 hypothetical protein BLE401_15015 [Beggiatoa leptomitoformis]
MSITPAPPTNSSVNNAYYWHFTSDGEMVEAVSLPLFLSLTTTPTGYALSGTPYQVGSHVIELLVGGIAYSYTLLVEMPSSEQALVTIPATDTAVLLVQLNYFNPQTSVVERHFIATAPYISKPTDARANTSFYECIVNKPTVSRELSGAFDGIIKTNTDALTVKNFANERDDWLMQSFGMRRYRMWVGSKNQALDTLTQIAYGYIAREGITTSGETQLSIPFRDATEILDNPLQTNTYTQTHIKNQIYPDVFGTVFNIEPICIDTALLIYQFHSGSSNALTAVRDGGIGLTLGIDYTDVDLQNSTFRLIQPVKYRLTCDVQGATWNGQFVQTVGDIINYVLVNRLPELELVNLAEFNYLCPQPVGIYIKEKMTFKTLFNKLLSSIGAFAITDNEGRLSLKRFGDVTGNPVINIPKNDIVQGSMELAKRIPPVASLRLGYKKNYTVQADSFAEDLTEAERQPFKQEWLIAQTSNTGIEEQWREATLLESTGDITETCLVNELDAFAEASRRTVMYSRMRDVFKFKVYFNASLLPIGSEITIAYNRFGLAVATNVIVLSISAPLIGGSSEIGVLR